MPEANTQTTVAPTPQQQPTLPPAMRGLTTSFDGASALIGQSVSAAANAEKDIKARDTKIESAIDDLQKNKFDQPPPQLDAKAFTAPQMEDPMKAWGSFAMTMGILASFATRSPLTTALKSATAAMGAIRDKNAAAYSNAFETWKANNDFAFKKASWENEQYRNQLELYSTNTQQALANLRALATLNQDDVMLAQIQQGNVQNIVQLVNDRSQLGVRWAEVSPQLQIQGMRMQAYMQASDAAKKDGHAWTPQENIQMLNQFFPTTAGAAFYREQRRLNPATEAEVKAAQNAYDQAEQSYRTTLTTKMGNKSDQAVIDARATADQKLAEFQDDVLSLNQAPGGAGTSPAPANAAPVPLPKEHAKDPDGTKYKGSDGVTYEKKGNQMVPVGG